MENNLTDETAQRSSFKAEEQEFRKAISEGKRKERKAIETFVEGAERGDSNLLCSGIDLVEQSCVWRRAFRAVAKHAVPMDLRIGFARVWLNSGDHIRSEVGDDLILIGGLKALLPPYA
jgi:hypothetical protein